jgi:hypothetical protein
MYIKEFEKEIQRDISPDLHIIRTQPDIAGIYYKNQYIGITTAPEFVFDNVNKDYTDNPPWWSGQKEKVIFRSRPLLKKLIKTKFNFIRK